MYSSWQWPFHPNHSRSWQWPFHPNKRDASFGVVGYLVEELRDDTLSVSLSSFSLICFTLSLSSGSSVSHSLSLLSSWLSSSLNLADHRSHTSTTSPATATHRHQDIHRMHLLRHHLDTNNHMQPLHCRLLLRSKKIAHKVILSAAKTKILLSALKVKAALEKERDRLDAVLVFPLMPEVMRLNKLGHHKLKSLKWCSH